MTDIVWPPSLPQSLEQGDYSEEPMDNTVEYENETPIPQSRPRFTSTSTAVQGSMFLTLDQKETLDEFYRETLLYGSLTFEWKKPGYDEVRIFKFVKGGLSFSTSGAVWVANISLLMLP